MYSVFSNKNMFFIEIFQLEAEHCIELNIPALKKLRLDNFKFESTRDDKGSAITQKRRHFDDF